MRQRILVLLLLALVPGAALALDGIVEINQESVLAAGGFPFVIDEPGSHALTGNLTVPANSQAIAIRSSTGWICTGNGLGVDIIGGEPQRRYPVSSITRKPDEPEPTGS